MIDFQPVYCPRCREQGAETVIGRIGIGLAEYACRHKHRGARVQVASDGQSVRVVLVTDLPGKLPD